MPTNYANDLITNISDDGMTEDLWNLVNDDVSKFKGLNITSDKERNLFFYLENFIDDLLKEFDGQPDDKRKILEAAFNYLRNDENVDLFDIRHAILLALRKNNKLAYPNIQGIGAGNLQPQRDISKWIKALGEIYAAMNSGENKYGAIMKITEGWDPMEKLDFLAWARYYENDDHEKYQLQRTAAPFQMPNIPQPQLPNISEEKEEIPSKPVMRGPGRPRKIRKTLQESKNSLISRLDSATRLLREFANVWPPEIWNRLAQALSDLKREIIPMKTIATMNDRIIRTAGIWDRQGFSEGADFLRKIAQPPEEDVATQIEKALTGREYETKPKNVGLPPMETEPMEEMPPMTQPPMEEPMPPAGVEEAMPPPEVPPEVTPEAPTPPPVPEEKEKEVISIEEENPFKGKTIQDALDVLEPLAQSLSEREFIHALSKADMILDSLHVASHFPELAEAQAKTLELNIYVLTRLKTIINKLKGSLKGDHKREKEETPPVEMEELKPKTEKEMFEVEEETPVVPTTPTPAVAPTPGR